MNQWRVTIHSPNGGDAPECFFHLLGLRHCLTFMP